MPTGPVRVSHRGAELLHLAHCLLQTSHYLVKGLGHKIEFVTRSAHRETLFQVVDVDGCCRSRQMRERRKRPRGHPLPHNKYGEEAERKAPHHEAPKAAERGIALVQGNPYL